MQQLLKQQLEHTFIPNASPKQKTATSTLKHELLYYLSTSSITPALPVCFASEMTCIVSSGALNSTHLLACLYEFSYGVPKTDRIKQLNKHITTGE